jgi:hypothetical protein
MSVAATAALLLGSVALSGNASANAAAAADDGSSGTTADQPAYERVDSFWMWSRPYSWQPIDDSSVVLWPTPFEPYLVHLTYPSHDMRFVQHLVVTSTNNRVYAKFDALQIRGFRYPIDSIYKITRDEAKNLESHKPEAAAEPKVANSEPH